jgi:hypothetical protein
MTGDQILGAVGSILALAAIISLAIIALARWANAYVERHQQPRRAHPPDFFRPARNRSRWG